VEFLEKKWGRFISNINEKFDNQPDKWWTKIVVSSIQGKI